MAYILINPPPRARGDEAQQIDDLRRWCTELAQTLNLMNDRQEVINNDKNPHG